MGRKHWSTEELREEALKEERIKSLGDGKKREAESTGAQRIVSRF